MLKLAQSPLPGKVELGLYLDSKTYGNSYESIVEAWGMGRIPEHPPSAFSMLNCVAKVVCRTDPRFSVVARQGFCAPKRLLGGTSFTSTALRMAQTKRASDKWRKRPRWR
jgi:hypothetical protein